MLHAPPARRKRGPRRAQQRPGGRSRGRISPVLALLLACACAGSERATNAPNLLLISIDTLRADHLSCYGYERETSPVIDALAAASLRFADAHAPTPWTLPSHVAMLTGRHPLDAGIYDKSSRIPDDVPVVAEPLSALGYQTAAFVDSGPGGFVGADRGFARGFDRFVHAHEPGDGRMRENDMRETVDRGLAWLEARDPERPFFLFLHTKSVHNTPAGAPDAQRAPYFKPEPHLGRFLPGDGPRFSWAPEGGSGILRELNLQLAAGTLAKDDLEPDRIEELVGLYDAGIYYVDEQLGRLLGELDRLGLRDDTVIVLTSDHGEAFLEERFFLHQELHHPLVHVPLLVHDPRPGAPRGLVPETVGLEAVAPMLLALAGAPGEDGNARQVAERWRRDREARFSYFHISADREYEAYGVEHDRWLLLHHRVGDAEFTSEWLHHERGAAETPDPALRDRLLERLETRFSALLEGAPTEAPLDADTLEELRALGYIE